MPESAKREVNKLQVLSISDGGGIYTDATTVTINGGMLMMDTAIGPTGVGGGGGGVCLVSNTTVTIENNSTISCNTTKGTQGGGGVYIGGSPTVTISNSAMNRNVASAGNGGGLHLGPGTTATLTDLTVECNSALQGGGIASDGTGANTTTMGGSLVVGNLANPGPDLLGAFTTAGNNTIGEAGGFTGITNGVDGDRVGTVEDPIPVLVQPPYCGPQPTPPAPSRLGRR